MKTNKLVSILLIVLALCNIICFALTVPWVAARWRGVHLTVELIGSTSGELEYALLGTFIMFCALISAIISITLFILLKKKSKKDG